MNFTRKDWEDIENQKLSSYACKSSDSNGRVYKEEPHLSRTCFARDRDRIFHSRCFRRLEYKTQVFVNGIADHFRTRLTHTMEMTAVGRTLARTLNVNEDLTECICLAHDLGHSPFGHEGERVLNELMTGYGGFDHNLQSLRCVEELESPYPKFSGLNLTWEVRAGLLKHESKKQSAKLNGYNIGPHQSLEAQIADIADDLTYQAHDVDDGIEAGIVSLEQLLSTKFWKLAFEKAKNIHKQATTKQLIQATIRTMIEIQVDDVIKQAEIKLLRFNPKSVNDIMNCSEKIIGFSDNLQIILNEFTTFMFENLYFHPKVSKETQKRVNLMRKLFNFYLENPETLGKIAQSKINDNGLHRTVCDYVSGCTDRFAMLECKKYGLTDE